MKRRKQKLDESNPENPLSTVFSLAMASLLVDGSGCEKVETNNVEENRPSASRSDVEFGGAHRIQNGKIAGTSVTWGKVAALEQLGYCPPPGEDKK